MGIAACLTRFVGGNIDEDEDRRQWLRQVKRAVLSAIEGQTGSKPSWRERAEPADEICEELGVWSNWDQFRRYAAHLDYAGRPPEGPVDNEGLDKDEFLSRYSELLSGEGMDRLKGLKFVHLAMTSDDIYFIPLDFPEPLLLEEEGEEQLRSIGSSPRLLAELDALNKWLGLEGDYGEIGVERAELIYENEQDPWRYVKWVWMVLHWLARESVRKRLALHIE